MRLVVLVGVVSLLADMTYEGARSINGSYLAILGATGVVVGLVAGFLAWGGLVPTGPQAISIIEQITHRQLGPVGRDLQPGRQRVGHILAHRHGTTVQVAGQAPRMPAHPPQAQLGRADMAMVDDHRRMRQVREGLAVRPDALGGLVAIAQLDLVAIGEDHQR